MFVVYMYLAQTQLTQDALDQVKQFKVPPQLLSLIRNFNMTGEISSIQYNQLFKTTSSSATQFICEYEKQNLMTNSWKSAKQGHISFERPAELVENINTQNPTAGQTYPK